MSRCLFTYCNDKFIPGCQVLLYSFLKNNAWFNDDIVIGYNTEVCNISEENKKLLQNLYDKIIFKEIDISPYSNLLEHWKYEIKDIFSINYLKLEAFKLEYDRVVYLDSDMVILQDISELFEFDNVFGICSEIFDLFDIQLIHIDIKQRNNEYINSGLFVINNPSIEKFNEIIHYGEIFDFKNNKLYKGCFEQDLLNSYFLNRVCLLLPSKYNICQNLYKNNNDCGIRDIAILHYSINKPWLNEDIAFKQIQKIWVKYWNELNNIEIKEEIKQQKHCVYIFTHYFTKFLLDRIFEIADVINNKSNYDLYVIYNITNNNEIQPNIRKLVNSKKITIFEYRDKDIINELSAIGYNPKMKFGFPDRSYTWCNIMFPIMSFYHRYPNYDHYLYIESDAIYKGDFNCFLDYYDSNTTDYINTYETNNKDFYHEHAFNIYPNCYINYTAFNIIFRLSKRAMEFLDNDIYRKGYNGYIEGFLPTLFRNIPDYTVSEYIFDGFVTKKTIKFFNKNIPSFSYKKLKEQNKFYHPVKK